MERDLVMMDNILRTKRKRNRYTSLHPSKYPPDHRPVHGILQPRADLLDIVRR